MTMKTSSKKWQKIRKIKGLRQFVTWYPRHVSENPVHMYNPDEDYQVMLAKLKTICQNKNITQYALAKATGMSTSSISCLMRGETKPYIYTVLTICDALNVTIADLLERQGYDENCEEDEDVREMIEAYQCLSPEKKRMLKVYMDMLLQYGGEL